MQRFCYVLNSDGVALIAVVDYLYNFFVESHAHLSYILYGIYDSYSLMKDSCGMDIATVIVEDNTRESTAASPFLNWKTT